MIPMTQYEKSDIVDKIHGYMIHRATDKSCEAFTRAKNELIAVLERQIACVQCITLRDMKEVLC